MLWQTPRHNQLRYFARSFATSWVKNARLIKLGKQPSNEQLINEQRAAEAVALARKELLAALSENLIDESGDEAASEARIGRSAPVLGH